MEVFSVGHSTHDFPVFLALLREHGIAELADVRTVPRSRRVPHFNAEALAQTLPRQGIAYRHFVGLGGLRTPRPGSPNTGWEHEGFRGFADHMATEEFERGLAELTALASERSTAFMCAEAVWSRCHRQLISDALVVRGWRVRHILPDGRVEDHRLTPFAVAEGERLTYPRPQATLDL